MTIITYLLLPTSAGASLNDAYAPKGTCCLQSEYEATLQQPKATTPLSGLRV